MPDLTWKFPALLLVAGVTAYFFTRRKRQKLRQPRKICRAIPKIELHYHLHGSLRPTTFLEFAKADNSAIDKSLIMRNYRTLAVCFSIFSEIHKLVISEERLRRLVREALEDLWLDNVRYAEIRTTPRAISDSLSTDDYLRIVTDEIDRFPHTSKTGAFEPGKITVRLLLSIDRAKSTDVAWQTLELALKFKSAVVGLDLAGNPFKGSFSKFRDFFEKARAWFPCSINTAEVLDHEDTDAVLEFGPERLGHFLLVTHKQWALARKKKIPIEICPTSNLKTLEIPQVKEHPTLDRLLLREKSDRLAIGTDDTGVFMTSLSAELESLVADFGLQFEDLKRLQRNAINMSFLPEILRDSLSRSMETDFDVVSRLA